MNISILIPSRNNLEFLKIAYHSIRRQKGNHFVEILVLDDKSDKDNTWEWCLETMQIDPNFKAFKNNRTERLGISGGYKFLSQQATQDVIGHFHADMFMSEGTLNSIEREFFICRLGEKKSLREQYLENRKKVVCLTRIEPPIYTKPGLYPEKIVWEDASIEIEDWDEQKFLDYLPEAEQLWNGKRTGGHFVPFFMFRKEYLELGGPDSDTFKFQAREDSDHAFRMVLAGYDTVQIPTFVYHFASRGNRRAKDNSGTWRDSPEWQEINRNSERNFIRKWGTLNLHQLDLTPNKPVKYSIGFKITNCKPFHLEFLEPWCDEILTDLPESEVLKYIANEQVNTQFDLVHKIDPQIIKPIPEIIVEIDGDNFGNGDFFNIQHLSEIITQSGEIGEFQLENLKITINAMNHYENDLIVCKNEPINLES